MDTSKGTARRLAALRAELARRRLHGFVVPRADEHQNEFVPPHAERLAWLTGFTGSAGVAVVLAEKAAIFTDGRYTLQVRREVDPALFAPLHIGETPPHDWLARELGEGQRLGFDSRLHTIDGAARLAEACRRAGADLVACEENPLDAVWDDDRPPPPTAAVEPYGAERAGRTSEAKRQDIAALLTEQRQDAAVLMAPDSIAWLLNIRGGDIPFTPLPSCMAIIHADAAVDLFLDLAKSSAALEKHLGPRVRLHDAAAFGEALAALGRRGARVRVDPAITSHWVARRLEDAGATLERAPDPCALPKARKTAEELEGARRAHRRDGAALCRFLAWLAGNAAAGITETQAAETLAEMRAGNDLFRGLSFPTISAAGANGAVVHYRSGPDSDRRLEPGSLYLVDSGAQYLDGTTDVTRTVAVGTPGETERRAFTLVLKGHIALATARFPKGTTGSQLDVLARQFLWRNGLDYDHGTGHGVGSYLGVHEGPQRISKAGNTVALERGMIVSNEPGYYREGAFGIRIESLVAVTADHQDGDERDMLAFETLTLAPIDRSLIEPALLTEDEKAWLNAYHRRVRDDIGPLLDPDSLAWLEAATRPL